MYPREPLWAVVWVVACVVLLTFGVVALRKRRAELQQEEAQEREAVEEGKRRGILLPTGRPACVVCLVAEATETWPVCDRSGLDKLTPFKELYALTPRYAIKDGGDAQQFRACKPCKRKAVQKWQEFLASKRAQVQQTFSRIEAEIAQLENGLLLAHLQREHEESRLKLESWLGTNRMLQLPAAGQDEGPITMPPMSTKTTETEEMP